MMRILIHYLPYLVARMSRQYYSGRTAIVFSRPEIRAFQLKCFENGWQILRVEIESP